MLRAQRDCQSRRARECTGPRCGRARVRRFRTWTGRRGRFRRAAMSLGMTAATTSRLPVRRAHRPRSHRRVVQPRFLAAHVARPCCRHPGRQRRRERASVRGLKRPIAREASREAAFRGERARAYSSPATVEHPAASRGLRVVITIRHKSRPSPAFCRCVRGLRAGPWHGRTDGRRRRARRG